MLEFQFRSLVGHQPWFFVPDTGEPGGAAEVQYPDGTVVECAETQITQKPRQWPDDVVAKGLGFKVPLPFMDEGTHVLTVTQDGVVARYTIEVVLDLRDLAANAPALFAELNRERRFANRPQFSLGPTVTAAGFTDRELEELNKIRTDRGSDPVTREG